MDGRHYYDRELFLREQIDRRSVSRITIFRVVCVQREKKIYGTEINYEMNVNRTGR